MFYRKRVWLATAVTLALLLTIVSVASAAQSPAPQSSAPPKPGAATPTPTPTRALPGSTGEEGSQNAAPAKPEPTRDLPGTTGGDNTGGDNTGGDNTVGDNTGGDNTAAPWPPPELIVAHAATPFQLSPIGEGLQSYFIGPDGTGYTGPYISSFTNLAQTYPAGAAVEIYSGVNPGSGKAVTIQYLPAEAKLRISTYYPDTQYDTDKPYVFTVDAGHNVVHDQW